MTNEMTPADIAAVTGNCGNGMFGGDGAWWLIVLFLFIFAGGWGNGMRGGTGVQDGYVLASDFANIERKIDTVNGGLCDGFYATAQLAAGINQNLAGGFANAELSRANQQAALMAQLNSMAMANQQCCCDTRAQLADVNYNIATTGCATTNAINQAVQAIVQNDNANYRSLHDEIVANKVEALQDRICEQNQQINALQLAASQSAQNQYLISQLHPTPVPSFPASNLYGYYNCGCSCS